MPEELRLARLKVFQAEEALYDYIHSQDSDTSRCRQLAEDVRIARDHLLDLLAKLWPDDPPQEPHAALASS